MKSEKLELIINTAKEIILQTGEYPKTIFVEWDETNMVGLGVMGDDVEDSREKAEVFFRIGRAFAQKIWKKKQFRKSDVTGLCVVTESWVSAPAFHPDGSIIRPTHNPARREALSIASIDPVTMKQTLTAYEMLRDGSGQLIDLLHQPMDGGEIHGAGLPCFLAGVRSAKLSISEAIHEFRRTYEKYAAQVPAEFAWAMSEPMMLSIPIATVKLLLANPAALPPPDHEDGLVSAGEKQDERVEDEGDGEEDEGMKFELPGEEKRVAAQGYVSGLRSIRWVALRGVRELSGEPIPDDAARLRLPLPDEEMISQASTEVAEEISKKHGTTNAPDLFREIYARTFREGFEFGLYAIRLGLLDLLAEFPYDKHGSLLFRFAWEHQMQESVYDSGAEQDQLMDKGVETIAKLHKAYQGHVGP